MGRVLPSGRRQRRLVAGTWRVLAFALLTAGALSLVGTGLWQSVRQLVQAPPTGTLRVEVSMSGFDPSRLVVPAGRRVQIELVNLDDQNHADGGGWHDFKAPALGVAEWVAPLGRTTFDLLATRRGTFRFYCDACCGGARDPAMNGAIVVE